MATRILVILSLGVLFLSGCSELLFETLTPPQETQPSATQLSTPTELSTQVPTPTVTPGPVVLRLWVPPEFDPSANTPAGRLLRGRLEDFSERRPGVQVEVRVKALDGAGGIIAALSAASAAAPLSMPDLVAMPRELLESAAPKGLLLPYDNLTDALESEDWYEYAQEMALIQKSIYGLPFAGDAQILVYRTDQITEPKKDWTATIESGAPLVFPAADPLALFTLNMYQANAGQVRDEIGAPILDSGVLSEVLTYFAEAEKAGVMPFWLTQYQTDEQVWDAYQEERTGQFVTWASSYFGRSDENLAMAVLPTPDGKAYTQATGWVWALATPSAKNQALSVELAEYLVESDFLRQWNEAMGYLPVRPSMLVGSYEPSDRTVLGNVLRSAKLFPPKDIVERLGAPMQVATMDVLKQQSDPLTAAQAAAASLTEP